MHRLLTHVALLILTFTSAALAQTDKPLLHDSALPVLATPSFAEPLVAPFVTSKGQWIPSDGVLSVVNIPAEKHIPVLHHKIGLASAVIELEFRLDGAGSFLVGCDSNKHVGRVVINAKGLSIAEDSVKPSHTIAELPLAVKQGQWHKLRVEWKDDQMAARLDGGRRRQGRSHSWRHQRRRPEHRRRQSPCPRSPRHHLESSGIQSRNPHLPLCRA